MHLVRVELQQPYLWIHTHTHAAKLFLIARFYSWSIVHMCVHLLTVHLHTLSLLHGRSPSHSDEKIKGQMPCVIAEQR